MKTTKLHSKILWLSAEFWSLSGNVVVLFLGYREHLICPGTNIDLFRGKNHAFAYWNFGLEL